MTMAMEEWTLALRQVFQDVQLQAVEASGYVRNPTVGLRNQRTLVPAVRRLNALFSDEVGDGKRGVAEEAFLLFLEETWLAVARVLLASKADVALQAVGAFMGEFLRRKSREPKGKCELRAELLQRLAQATQAEDRGVRLRACHMLQLVVNRLDGVEQEQAKMLKEALLRRLKDKVTAVRVQSVYGLKPLQGDEEDPVTIELKKLMVSDPSKDVRKAALLSLPVRDETYQDVVVRVRDSSEDVRYAAFRTIGDALPLAEIPLSDRAQLLAQGLQDRAARVRRACEHMVLTKWFPACGASPTLLLKALDIEQNPEVGAQVSRLLLGHFAEQPLAKEGGVELNALELMAETRDGFNAENVFFWREQCHYYQKIDRDPAKAAALVPNVSDFSKMLAATCEAQSDVLFLAQQLLEFGHLLDFQDEFGRRHLLECLQKLLRALETDSQLIKGIMELMAFVYSGSSEHEFIQVVAEIVSDMYDPVEAATAEPSSASQQSADDMRPAAVAFGPQLPKLSGEQRRQAEDKFDELEARLETLESDSDEYSQVQAEMMELEAELQDPRVLSWLRCLEIVAQLLKLTSHNLSDPIVDGMGRYILPAIDSDVPALREAGLENLGLFCLLDKRLAERYLVVFWRALNNPEEERDVKHTCVQAILDMAFSFSRLQPHIFGAQRGENKTESETQEAAETAKADDKEQPPIGADKLDLDTIFVGLGQLLSVDDLDLQSTLVEGFCRLFLLNRIDKMAVLAILLETYLSPTLQQVQRRREHGFQSRSVQLLSLFFPAFVVATPANCMLLEEAATHLIQKAMERLESADEATFDLGACAKYVLHLLSHNELEEEAASKAKRPRRRCAHHNRIGITVCLEILALEKVAARPDVRQDVVTGRQRALLKMLAWVEVTRDERRSAALFQHLLQEMTASCFAAQRGLLRSAEAVLKRTAASLTEQSAGEGDEQQAATALAQDETWAHGLVAEREDALKHVLLEASVEHEKTRKRLEKEKKKRRRNAKYVSSGSDESSDGESEEDDDEQPAVPARRELAARRSKTAAVSRMHEKEGEFEARIKQALQADDADEEEEEEEEESESDEEEEEEEEESAEEGEEEAGDEE